MLVAASGAAWYWIALMGVDMYGAMTGASRWMMTPAWDAPHLALLFLMWTVMMAAMMLPSVSPLLLLYHAVAGRRATDGYRPSYVYAAAAGYLASWTLFSAGATVLQRVLTSAAVVNPMMAIASRRTGGLVLAAAGIYQMLPIKQRCLVQCRASVSFLTRYAQPGPAGAFRLGVRHGLYCVGCCWALMLLLLVGGVMNLWVIVGLAAFVAIEKLAPFRHATSLAAGAALVIWGGWLAR